MPKEPGTALVCIGCGPVPQDSDGNNFSAGLHPWDVTENFADQLNKLEALLANPRVLAIGECGFDSLKGPAHELQEQAFIRQIELSELLNKPMILHIVRDFDTPIRLRKQLKPQQPWLIHGFRGNLTQITQLYTQGILVSFGRNHNKEALKNIPSNRLFLETDGQCPIQEVIQTAALLRAESQKEVEQQLNKNINRFLLSL